jgi:hypothetical protein
VVITFDDNGVVKEAKGDPILIDSSFKPDEAITPASPNLAKPIEDLRKKVIGSSKDRSRAPAKCAASGNARWAISSPTPCSTASRLRA